MQKSIQFIEKLEDIELLKPYSIKLLKTNAKQAHFVSTSLDVIASQQAYIYKLEKRLDKKKATFWDRFRYIIFGKNRGLTDFYRLLTSLIIEC